MTEKSQSHQWIDDPHLPSVMCYVTSRKEGSARDIYGFSFHAYMFLRLFLWVMFALRGVIWNSSSSLVYRLRPVMKMVAAGWEFYWCLSKCPLITLFGCALYEAAPAALSKTDGDLVGVRRSTYAFKFRGGVGGGGHLRVWVTAVFFSC